MAPETMKIAIYNPSPFQFGTTIKVCLVLSFLFHTVTILAFHDTFNLEWTVEKPRTYKVDLIRAPVEDLDPDEKPVADISQTKEEIEPPSTLDQDTISLDTKDKRYVSYAKLIKEKIGSHWKYPSAARARLIEGRLMVLFSLVKEGEVIEINLLDPSGCAVLDEEAVRAIRAAAPFPPFPDHVTVKRLNVQASFDYRLTAKK
jgi:TonB family protein